MFKYILLVTIFFIKPAFSKTYNLEYVVYAGGLKGLYANITINIKKNNHFEINSDVKTTGFTSVLYPLIAKYKTTGEIKDGKFYTFTYQYENKVRKKIKTRFVDYKDKKDFIDVQTFILKSIVEINKNYDCPSKNNLFMGSRDLTISLNDKKTFTTNDSDYGIFKGEGIKCTTLIDTDDIERKENSWFFRESRGALQSYFGEVKNNKLLVKIDMGSVGYGKIIAYLEGANVTE